MRRSFVNDEFSDIGPSEDLASGLSGIPTRVRVSGLGAVSTTSPAAHPTCAQIGIAFGSLAVLGFRWLDGRLVSAGVLQPIEAFKQPEAAKEAREVRCWADPQLGP